MVVDGLFSWPGASGVDREGAGLPESDDAFRARFNGDFGDGLGLDGVDGITAGWVLANLAERKESFAFDRNAEEGVRGLAGKC